MSISPSKFFLTVIFFAMISIFAGCGQQQPPQQISATKVKVIPVLRSNAPMSYEYSGQVIGKGEVKVQSKIAGRIVEKYIRGGQNVTEGQPLYKIDSRQYEANVLQLQAQLAKSKINLSNERLELDRDQRLYDAGAVSEQVLSNQQVKVNAMETDVMAAEASLSKAQEDLVDTVVYAPMSGRLAIDDLAIGTYVTPGSTNLVTIGNNDPIFVQFSISENEYLKFMNADKNRDNTSNQRPVISLTLADGTIYPYDGRFAEADRALTDNTGTLTLRTLFDNPDNLLVPGMFARIVIDGISVPNAILVPERAVQQLLGDTFVLAASAENKSEVKPVKLGEKVGSYYIITEGLKGNEMIIVEGLSKLRDNVPLNPTVVTAADMGFSLENSTKLFDADK